MEYLGLILLLGGIIAAVRQQRFNAMTRTKTIQSPLALALAQVVGTAGGIYLSLELLFSFLQLPEDWWAPSTFVVEPLAVLSLVLAILQPFVIKYWNKLMKRK